MAVSTASTPSSLFGISLPAVGLQHAEGRERSRKHVADRLVRALRDQIAVTYDEPQVLLASGLGRVAFSAFTDGPAREKGVVLHARTESSSGRRVDLCLFGSVDNTVDFRAGEAVEGSSSSAWSAVAQLLESRGTRTTSQWDEPGLAIEALKIALGGREGAQGGSPEEPWTRPWALGHATDVEWLAVIYSDVTLDPERWDFDGTNLEGTQRIIVGAPLWVRTAGPQAVVRYADLRQPQTPRLARWRRPGVVRAGDDHLRAGAVSWAGSTPER
ncbi:hypothetical protein [Kitasatospora sp. MBT66]|uniref:hypothetical protein n=1 Tax=Kitasatospora sp. MBT66 TaxID=1444769 RepID=UPI0013141CE6|nr:hypothetical protein [Kitasatospora sp. MBT66]